MISGRYSLTSSSTGTSQIGEIAQENAIGTSQTQCAAPPKTVSSGIISMIYYTHIELNSSIATGGGAQEGPHFLPPTVHQKTNTGDLTEHSPVVKL